MPVLKNHNTAFRSVYKTLLGVMLLFTLHLHATEIAMPSIYEIEVVALDGTKTTLAPYQGKVMLIVNVASECGFTPQYEGLQALYEKYQARGFMVLGFPCNQFGAQEPANEAEILSFCRVNFGVTFPIFAKIDVNGAQASPLYSFLKKEQSGILGTEAIKWNFTKFLVDRDGKVVKRFAPSTTPQALELEIQALLN